MAIYNGFDINTAATPAPWGAREEQVIKDIIDTLVGDSIGGAKATSGHVHNNLYYDASNTAVTIDGSGNATFIGTVGVNDLDVTTNIDTATLVATGTVGVNDLDVTVNIDTATMTATGTVGVNDLDVTTNIDTATLIATGTVGVNDLDVTTNIDTATMTATGTVGVNDLDVTTNIDTATMTATGTVGINNLDVTTNIDTATLRTTSTVGIGIATPDGTCHIHTATAGTVVANANYDELVLESSGNTGMSILAPDASLASIAFGSPSDSAGADISWLYNNHELIIETSGASGFITFKVANSATAMTIDASGEVGVGTTAPEHGIESVLTDATNAKKNIHARSSGANSDAFVGFQNDAIEYSIGVNGANDAWIIQEDGVTTRMTILPTTGYVGINTASPSGLFTVDTINAGDAITIKASTQSGSYTSIGYNTNSSVVIGRSGTSNIIIDSSGNVGLNLYGYQPTSRLDLCDGNNALTIGANNGTTTRTDSATKAAKVGMPHYLSSTEEQVCMILGSATNTANLIRFGGGTGTMNAATEVSFWTAANYNTTVGSQRFTIDSSGYVSIAGDMLGIATTKTPASAAATGTTGSICWDADYIYVCTATNTWKRASIATW